MTKGGSIIDRVRVKSFTAGSLRGSQIVGAGLYARLYALSKDVGGVKKLVYIVEKGMVFGGKFYSQEKIERDAQKDVLDLFRECRQTINMLVRGGQMLDMWPRGDVYVP